MLPDDFGFEKTRGGHRWEEWRRGEHRVGYELVDEKRGEWTVYSDGPSGKQYDDAWTRGDARRRAAGFAESITGGL